MASDAGKPQTSTAAPRQQPDLLRLFLSGASAACVAEAATLPFDTAKVRLQLQNLVSSSSGGPQAVPPKYRGPIQTLVTIVEQEGFRAPFKGLVPGLHRQFIFTGVRLGLYEQVKKVFHKGPPGSEPVTAKIGAALITSGLGITLANPSDVLKVRFQAHNDLHGERPYSGAFHAYRVITREEGFFAGLYRGYGPNLLRNSLISSTEIVTYDTSKTALLRRGYSDGLPVHLSCAIAAGAAATAIGSPADVIGTRLMVMTSRPGVAAFTLNIIKNEGLLALYKGALPNFVRLGSFNICLWLSYEKIRGLMG